MSTDQIDDEDGGQFTQRVVPAGAAPRVKTSAAASVFALGSAMVATQPESALKPPRRSQDKSIHDRAFKTIESCGRLTSRQLAEALQIGRQRACQLMYDLKKAGQVAVVETSGSVSVYGVAKAPSTGAATAPITTPDAAPSLVCGLLSTGELLMEFSGQTMRLPRNQARELVSYLDKVAAALAGD